MRAARSSLIWVMSLGNMSRSIAYSRCVSRSRASDASGRSDRAAMAVSSALSDGLVWRSLASRLWTIASGDVRQYSRRSPRRLDRMIRPDGSSIRTAPLMAPRLAPIAVGDLLDGLVLRLADEEPGPETARDGREALQGQDGGPPVHELLLLGSHARSVRRFGTFSQY